MGDAGPGTLGRWRAGLRTLALLAWGASWFLPTLRLGPDASFVGWEVFVACVGAVSLPHLWLGAILTIVLPVLVVERFRGPSTTAGLWLSLAGLLLAAACGAHVALPSEVGTDRLGPGYWCWASFFVLALAAGLLGPRPAVDARPPTRSQASSRPGGPIRRARA